MPWFKSHVDPWLEIGANALLLDHVPKQREDRPRGPIGSQHKLARVTGAALDVSGIPWTKRTGGKIFLKNHKDRGGDLPAPVGKCVAVIVGNYQGEGDARAFGYTIEPPEQQEDADDMNIAILSAVADAGPDGVTGLKAMRGLVTGKGTTIDTAIRNLVDGGMLAKTRVGKSDNYIVTSTGLMLLAED